MYTCAASVNIMKVSKLTFKLCILEMWDKKCKLESKIYCKQVYVLVEVIVKNSLFHSFF